MHNTQTSMRPKTGKLLSSIKKKPHRSISKDKDDKCLTLIQENNEIKKQKNDLMDKIKTMSTQLIKIQKEMKIVNQLDAGPEDPMLKNQLLSLDSINSENKELKEKLAKLTLVISSLKKGTYTSKKVKKDIKPAQPSNTIGKSGDFKDKLIDQLKKRLSDTEVQLQRAQNSKTATLPTPGLPASYPELNRTMEYKERESIELNFKAKEQIFERTKSMLDDALQENATLKTEIEKLKAKIKNDILVAEQDKELAREYRILKEQKDDLERRYIDLSETPFIKNPNGQIMANRLRELESDNLQLKTKMENMNDQMLRKEVEKAKIEDKYNTAEVERIQFKEENVRLKARYEGNGLNMGEVQQLLRENDPVKFREVMDKLNITSELPKWANLDFLEKGKNLDNNNVKDLQKELERLTLEKGTLASELEKAQLQLKLKTEEEKEQIELSNARIKELQERLKDTQFQNKQLTTTYKSPTKAEMQKSIAEEEDNQSDFSQISVESMIEPGQNKIDVNIDRIELNKEAMISQDLIDGTEMPFTYLIIDFPGHDHLTTEVASDFIQENILQAQFDITMDEKIKYMLMNSPVRVIMCLTRNGKTSEIAEGKASLESLITAQAYKPQTSQVLLICSLNKDVSIGTVKLKYRLRHPLHFGFI